MTFGTAQHVLDLLNLLRTPWFAGDAVLYRALARHISLRNTHNKELHLFLFRTHFRLQSCDHKPLYKELQFLKNTFLFCSFKPKYSCSNTPEKLYALNSFWYIGYLATKKYGEWVFRVYYYRVQLYMLAQSNYSKSKSPKSLFLPLDEPTSVPLVPASSVLCVFWKPLRTPRLMLRTHTGSSSGQICSIRPSMKPKRRPFCWSCVLKSHALSTCCRLSYWRGWESCNETSVNCNTDRSPWQYCVYNIVMLGVNNTSVLQASYKSEWNGE